MHLKFLQEALLLAQKGRGFCAPNPAVGALVVKENKILAGGYHQGAGLPHAEVVALNQLEEEAQGATIYITLEPCCHFGKTPPCTQLLIKRGIRQVIYGYTDPNPVVAGKGANELKAAGIDCQFVPLPEINAFYESYTFWLKHKRPFVTYKLALSLDGKIAGSQGQPIKLTHQKADQFTHGNRFKTDAILTTAKTILRDNPRLNARLNNKIIAKPIYIIDRYLKTPLTSTIINTAKSLTIFYAKDAKVCSSQIQEISSIPIRFIAISERAEGLNMTEILEVIGSDGPHDVWVEAGGSLFHHLYKNNLLQRAYLILAPLFLGSKAQAAFDDEFNMAESASRIDWQALDKDVLCEINW